ncbi:hypothetical protein OKW35_008659 [Paraburkholderia sp. MM5477-R1]
MPLRLHGTLPRDKPHPADAHHAKHEPETRNKPARTASIQRASSGAPEVFPVYRGRTSRLYWYRLSLTTVRHFGVLHCETEPLHDKRCTAS